MELNHQLEGLRAKKARFGKSLTGIKRTLLLLLSLLIIMTGGFIVYAGSGFGWVIIACSVWPALFLIWYQYELHQVPLGQGETIESRIEGDVLAHLPINPSPKDIAQAAMQTLSGQFFAVRFGISPTFLSDFASTDPKDTVAVWVRADEIISMHTEATLNGAVLVAALVGTQPQLVTLLPHLQIDEGDLVAGAGWYGRLASLIEEQKRAKRTGGIARDWSFGYTPVLTQFGINISEQIAHGGLLHVRLDSHQSALGFLLDTFGSNGRQNVVLVGPLGAGKTSIVHAFAELLMKADTKLPPSLQFRQVISLDANALISYAQTKGDLENLVNRLLVEAYKAKNIIICLDDAQLFFDNSPGSVDISSILLPVLEGGRLRMILTMDEQRWLQIAQRNPALVAALNRVSVAPATERESMLVMQDQLIVTEFQRKVTYMYQSLKEAYRLSERYIHEQSQPGRAVQLLESAAAYADDSLVTARSVQKAIEQSRGVKVGNANDNAEDRDKLLNLETLIHERMINQTRAVSVVSDAIRRARTGVRNENRPIGTFLFLGPTGVGKTELAKSLASVYFGGEEHMVRIDMNEYVGQKDVSRLIADGANDPHSLTASIMKQPFSVVLLDEIEKAHPQVLTTLLQLLDEGVLRDINNREISFRDAIIIATSNAGAERIRELIGQGHEIEKFEAQLVNELIDSGQFRPEFLNRFDEIVLFRPLTEGELTQLVSLMIDGINKTMAHQKITVTVDDAAKRKLASVGYDPRLGARPMRRVVQRSVENLIAKKMLEGSAAAGDTIEIHEEDIKTT